MKQKIDEIRIKVPKELLENIDLLVKGGIYPNRNEVIRDAIRKNIRGGAS